MLAIKMWNLLEGNLHSPLLPVLAFDWGIDDITDLLERMALIRDSKRDNNLDT